MINRTEDDLLALRYEKNFLSKVVFKVDVSPILRISTEKPTKFQEEIRDTFPGFKELFQLQMITSFKGNERVLNESTKPMYQFESKEKDTIIQLMEDYLIIETKKYEHFDKYKEMILNIMSKYENTYKPLEYKRIGLRYINQITFEKGNPTDWDKYLEDSIIGMFSFPENKKNISRIMSQICINKDSYNVIFNYGIPNIEFPAKISRKEFTLDYDIYTKECEAINISEKLSLFNKEVKILFEKSIKEDLRKEMNIKKG